MGDSRIAHQTAQHKTCHSERSEESPKNIKISELLCRFLSQNGSYYYLVYADECIYFFSYIPFIFFYVDLKRKSC